MYIKPFVFNPFYENTYVVYSKVGNALIIDPGCYEDHEVEEISSFVSLQNLRVQAIINTHCHIDHVLGNEILKQKFSCPLKIPENEVEVFNAVAAYAPQWGITGYQPAQVDEFLQGGKKLLLDDIEFELIEVPGHSPGHLVFYEATRKKVIGGDVLFRESIGRTDLPGGNHDDLLRNIQEKLYVLSEDVTVYPGHGSETTIGHEKANNPFVRG